MCAQQRRNPRTKLAEESRIAKHRGDRHRQCLGEAGEGGRLGSDQLAGE
jgi:hypothetical protein